MFCDKENRHLSTKIYRVYFGINFLRFAWLLNNFLPFIVPVEKNSLDRIWDGGRKHKIANSEETAFITLFFRHLNDLQDDFHKFVKILRDFTEAN